MVVEVEELFIRTVVVVVVGNNKNNRFQTFVCCVIYVFKNFIYNNDNRRANIVFACTWSSRVINPKEIVNNYPFAHELILNDGDVRDIVTDFPPSKNLRYLSLIKLNIKKLNTKIFYHLENLLLLDLSDNKLKSFSGDLINNNFHLKKINLKGNHYYYYYYLN